MHFIFDKVAFLERFTNKKIIIKKNVIIKLPQFKIGVIGSFAKYTVEQIRWVFCDDLGIILHISL